MSEQSAFRAPRAVLRETLLWLAAAMGGLSVLVAVAAVLLQITPIVFKSGSMAPGIPVGALALAQETAVSEIEDGDVVSFFRSDGARVTHRVDEVATNAQGEPILLTKGDANPEADPDPVAAETVDRVFWSVPEVGFWLTEARKPPYTFGAGVLVGMIALLGFLGPARRQASPPAGDTARSLPETTAPGTSVPRTRPSLARRSLGLRSLRPRFLTRSTGPGAPVRSRKKRNSRTRTLVGGALVLGTVVAGIGAVDAAPVGTLASFTDAGSRQTTFSAAASFATLGAVGSYPLSVWVNYQDPTRPGCTVTTSSRSRAVTFTWGYATGAVPTHYVVVLMQRDGGHAARQQVTARSATFEIPLDTARYGMYDVQITAENGSASSTPAYLEFNNLDSFWAGCTFAEPQPVVPASATAVSCTTGTETSTYRDITFALQTAGGSTAARYDVAVTGDAGHTMIGSSTGTAITVRVPLPSTGRTSFGDLPVLIQALDLKATKDAYAATTTRAVLRFTADTALTVCYTS